MRVRVSDTDHGTPHDDSLWRVVTNYLQDTGDVGALEEAAATSDNCAEMMGRLVEMLVEQGLLHHKDILRLMPHFGDRYFEIVKE